MIEVSAIVGAIALAIQGLMPMIGPAIAGITAAAQQAALGAFSASAGQVAGDVITHTVDSISSGGLSSDGLSSGFSSGGGAHSGGVHFGGGGYYSR